MVYLILFLVGALFIPAGDFAHVLSGTTFYNPLQLQYTIFGVVPWWVPFLFGMGGVGAGIHTTLVRKKFPRIHSANLKQSIISGTVFLGMYLLSAILFKNWSTDGVLLICAVLLYRYAGDRTIGGFLQTIGIVMGGVGFEVLLVHLDVFHYNALHDELFGVAPWLIFLYLGVAVSADSIVAWSQKFNQK